jgi:hypothetical protein
VRSIRLGVVESNAPPVLRQVGAARRLLHAKRIPSGSRPGVWRGGASRVTELATAPRSRRYVLGRTTRLESATTWAFTRRALVL